ncbi:DUF4861 domain-containing protein [bacterium]|nr:MAG: DUF4861 domain-containing protein [bacterium]
MGNIMLLVILGLILAGGPAPASAEGWYTEGNFAPAHRLQITLVNSLDVDRNDCPIIIARDQFPVKKLHEMWVTVVDPSLPPKPKPSNEELRFAGGHGIREESNGHQVFCQLDDLDKDGIWDELYFQTNIRAHESKTLYVYIGFSGRGWNPHGTHATIGSYCRHIIPWWESANIGWKLWFPTSVDMYGKRKPVLMSEEMCIHNYCGYYGVPKVNFDYGSDIMGVGSSFGAGGIGLFEDVDRPDSISIPRFTPFPTAKISERNFNEDQITDTRYAFDVVVNGPLRSIVRIKTMNWNSGRGSYELEQYYTAYTNQSYSTCKVRFTKFFPTLNGVRFGCGIKSNSDEAGNLVEPGMAVRSGSEQVADPDDDTGQKSLQVNFVGSALVVKDQYKPLYHRIRSMGGNHAFSIPVTGDLAFEYLIAGAWSEGAVYNSKESFISYVRKTALEYNNPVTVQFGALEQKKIAGK